MGGECAGGLKRGPHARGAQRASNAMNRERGLNAAAMKGAVDRRKHQSAGTLTTWHLMPAPKFSLLHWRRPILFVSIGLRPTSGLVSEEKFVESRIADDKLRAQVKDLMVYANQVFNSTTELESTATLERTYMAAQAVL